MSPWFNVKIVATPKCSTLPAKSGWLDELVVPVAKLKSEKSLAVRPVPDVL